MVNTKRMSEAKIMNSKYVMMFADACDYGPNISQVYHIFPLISVNKLESTHVLTLCIV